MKKALFLFSMAFCCCLFLTSTVIAQEVIQEGYQIQKQMPTNAGEKKITVLTSENNYKTLRIINPSLRAELFNSTAKRHEITALPGFLSLAIEENEIRITVEDQYIKKYLTTYFDCKESDLNSLSY